MKRKRVLNKRLVSFQRLDTKRSSYRQADSTLKRAEGPNPYMLHNIGMSGS